MELLTTTVLLATLSNLSLADYGIIGLVLIAIIGIVKRQIDFSNKMVVAQAKKRDEDLDKISAALIILQENSKVQTEICRENAQINKDVSEQQRLLAQQMGFLTELALKNKSP